ncbi:MAG TPA: hypothetical protein VN253_05540 [Kofleriaceae bacterium]|nr:hypothetical protein [Kofleriaceae bacterium]
MKHSVSWPSWGVLIHAQINQVRDRLGSLCEEDYFPDYFPDLIFRTSGDWTAIFYPKDDAPNDDVADLFRTQGFDVAFLTFHDDAGDHVHRWDGRWWSHTGEEPYELCRQHGISISGKPLEPGPPIPYRSVRVRAMSLVEGMRADAVRPLIDHPEDPSALVEDGPRGALVIQEDLPMGGQPYGYLSEVVTAPVYHVEFDPRDGRFACLRLENGDEKWQFDTGDSWIRSGAPRVNHVEGETAPLAIVRKLGMPDWLVDLEDRIAEARRPEGRDRDGRGRAESVES